MNNRNSAFANVTNWMSCKNQMNKNMTDDIPRTEANLVVGLINNLTNISNEIIDPTYIPFIFNEE